MRYERRSSNFRRRRPASRRSPREAAHRQRQYRIFERLRKGASVDEVAKTASRRVFLQPRYALLSSPSTDMSAKKILTVGAELASADTQYTSFASKLSLLDWDIILFKPEIGD